MKKLTTLLFLAFCMASIAHAKVWMPTIFDSGMVLQRESNVKLWGTTDAGKTVKVTTSWNKKTYRTTANSNGKWNVSVSTPEAGGPYSVTVTDGEAVTFDNVLIGEVWICAGQSNMEMPMKGFPSQPIENGPADILHSTDPLLHVFQSKRISRVEPTDTTVGQWKTSEPEVIRDFAATAYYFGRELRRTLNVPIGLIVTAWGGSSCESWIAREYVKPFVTEKSPYQIPYKPSDIKSKNRQPTVLFNGMLNPVIGYGIKGAIFYQGEDNVPRYQDYAQQLQTMVGCWRDKWGIGEFPFYYCQIAPYEYSLINWTVNSALLREQQYIAETQIPNAGMAVLMDAGIEKGIHPPKKSVAGERLAMLALVKTYGWKGITAESARYKSMTVENGKAILEFERDKMNLYGANSSFTSHLFEIAGEDRVFHPATVELHKRKFLAVYSPEVKNPVAVRYAFKDWCEGDLFCDGLPLSSFRTDNWPVEERKTETTETKDYDKQR
ncbi:sialate O-acetylesterase [Prevotella sp. PINT]|jgi:Domain of unknown function (DUF303).|uniref:sialate O-acetylesterase n=1 Tax=Palleniella intestinalis TaxID=2736291 RepID=UPI0015556064|nr:sialate O-acetylesterase [Palleniella intestinalis]NPD81961.1 sialate O-acetylesterase [Palleniella intestinalis]